jgi:dTMP kinase
MTTTTGLLVTIDGPGGAGKTTTAKHLTELLRRRGYRVHPTRQPTTGELGQIARQRVNTYRGHALACLVAADRYHHLATEISPRKVAGEIVICDRYVAASLVLQRMDGVPTEFIEAVNRDVDIPDLSVILTVDPTVAAHRIDQRGTRHRFETGVESSIREVELYSEATQLLAGLGYPTLNIDTTHLSPEHVAKQIAERIINHAAGPRIVAVDTA